MSAEADDVTGSSGSDVRRKLETDRSFDAYAELVAETLDDDSEILRAVSLYHVGELGLDAAAIAAASRRPDASPAAGDGDAPSSTATEGGVAAVLDFLDHGDPTRRVAAS